MAPPILDLPPKLWVPESPAIIRSATPEIIKPVLGITMLARLSMVRAKRQAVASGPGYSNLAYVTGTNQVNNDSPYELPGVTLPAEAADRVLLAAIVWGGSSVSVSSFQWTTSASGTVSATQIAHTTGANGGAAIYGLSVPTGTVSSGLVDMDAGSTLRLHGGFYTVNMSSLTPHDTDSAAVASGAGTLSSLTIPNNGFALTACYLDDTTNRDHSINASYTEDNEQYSEVNSAFSHREVTTAATDALTSTWTGSTSAGVMIGASFNGYGT